MTKVLLVEDDALIAGTVMYYLEKTETYEVTRARTAG